MLVYLPVCLKSVDNIIRKRVEIESQIDIADVSIILDTVKIIHARSK